MNKYKLCATIRELIICLLEHEDTVVNVTTILNQGFCVTWLEKEHDDKR